MPTIFTKRIHHQESPPPKPKSRPAGFRLQPRDVAIIEAMHRHRVLATDQIAALFFCTATGAVSSACRGRLRHLVGAGLLEQAEQLQTRSEGRRPYLYMLTAPGRDLLVTELGLDPGEIDWKPSYNSVAWQFLSHQLAINEAYVAFRLACERIGWRVERWVDDRFLKKLHTEPVSIVEEDGGRRNVAVVPDAYFILSRGEQVMHFFLELDRATMAVAPQSRRTKSWQRRIRAYRAYLPSAAAVKRYGTDRIRVLTVTTGEGRMTNLAGATAEVAGPLAAHFWFTTSTSLIPEAALTEPIWQVAGHGAPQALVL